MEEGRGRETRRKRERAQALHVFRDPRATLGMSPWLQLYLRQDPLGHGNIEQPS